MMQASEIVKAAWNMHRGQPGERKHDICKDHLCNLITWNTWNATEDEVLRAMECIRYNLPNTYPVNSYGQVFIKEYPQYATEDWEVYKHMAIYLEAKAKWVAGIVAQLRQNEVLVLDEVEHG